MLCLIETYINQLVSNIILHSPRSIRELESKISFKDFQERIKLPEFREIMILILPSLCKSEDFLKVKVKRDKDKAHFLKVILEQLDSDSTDRIMIGLNSLISLNNTHRELLQYRCKDCIEAVAHCVRSNTECIKTASVDFLVSILSNWSGKEREVLVSNFSPLYLLDKIEDEESNIILRLLDWMKIIMTKDKIKMKQEEYIDKIILLMSHKDLTIKNKAIETLTLIQNISEFVLYLATEKFIMEKLLSCLRWDDDKIKKNILNLLQVILSDPYENMIALINENRIEDTILEEIEKQIQKLKAESKARGDTNFDIILIQCNPECQILNSLHQVQNIIICLRDTQFLMYGE